MILRPFCACEQVLSSKHGTIDIFFKSVCQNALKSIYSTFSKDKDFRIRDHLNYYAQRFPSYISPSPLLVCMAGSCAYAYLELAAKLRTLGTGKRARRFFLSLPLSSAPRCRQKSRALLPGDGSTGTPAAAPSPFPAQRFCRREPQCRLVGASVAGQTVRRTA